MEGGSECELGKFEVVQVKEQRLTVTRTTGIESAEPVRVIYQIR